MRVPRTANEAIRMLIKKIERCLKTGEPYIASADSCPLCQYDSRFIEGKDRCCTDCPVWPHPSGDGSMGCMGFAPAGFKDDLADMIDCSEKYEDNTVPVNSKTKPWLKAYLADMQKILKEKTNKKER